MAAQLKGTNGFWARGEQAWMARATISLPVPLSPVMSTLTVVRATFCARVIVSRMWPAMIEVSPSTNTSSAGQIVARSSRSARARSSSWRAAMMVVIAFSALVVSMLETSSTISSTWRDGEL